MLLILNVIAMKEKYVCHWFCFSEEYDVDPASVRLSLCSYYPLINNVSSLAELI
jgi:hypothetical protein